MLKEVVLMPKEIVHCASEKGGNDRGKRKINHRYSFSFFIFPLLFNIQPFSAWIKLPYPLPFTGISLSYVYLFPPGAQ